MPGARVMIVEDEMIVAECIAASLEHMGHTIASMAMSGEEALKMIEQPAPDLIIMDIRLGGDLDGIETAIRINRCANTPVIFLTACADDETIGRLKSTNSFGYILKPYNNRELAASIEITLYKARMEQELRRAKEELSERVDERTAELMAINETLRHEITERKEAQEKLLSYQERLRSSASGLFLNEAEERQNIASDLHDHIGQTLALANIKLGLLRESVSDSGLTQSVDEIATLINSSIRYIRDLVFDLSPPLFNEIGLAGAIRQLSERFQEEHRVAISFKDDRKWKLPENKVKILLYRAVRELLINAVKHAKAAKIQVSLLREHNDIRIDVKDDGVGFDPGHVRDSAWKTHRFGLFNICERLDYFGGQAAISSEPGQGTCVSLIMPLGD